MKIDLLFSKPNKFKFGAYLIRYASTKNSALDFNSTPSHVAILMNNTIVAESTFATGVRLIPYYKWQAYNYEVAKIPHDHKDIGSQEVFHHLMDVWDKPYDWCGIMFFAWSYLQLILFKKELPSVNRWQRNTHFFCTEFAARLTGVDCSMKTPADLLKIFLNTK